MILRRIIDIDEERCNGCGACAEACHEGAIVMIDNKAHSFETITVTDWATVCRPVLWTQFIL